MLSTYKKSDLEVSSKLPVAASLLSQINKLITDSAAPDNAYKVTVPGGILELKKDKQGFTLSHLIEHFEQGKGVVFSETHIYRWSKDARFCGSSTFYTNRMGDKEEREGLSEPFAIKKLEKIIEVANQSDIDLGKYNMGS